MGVPRRARVHCPEGVYHVVARGVRKQRIFFQPQEYRAYLRLLREASRRYGLRVLAYVLMPNHVHLLVRVSDVPLSRAMQFLQGRFARWYNRQYGYAGHLFQSRYGAHLCQDERYLWALVRYIHENPVRAGLTPEAWGYRWSSFREYAAGRWEVVDGGEAVKVLERGQVVALAEVPGANRWNGGSGPTTPELLAHLDPVTAGSGTRGVRPPQGSPRATGPPLPRQPSPG